MTELQRFYEAFMAELEERPNRAPGPAGIARRMGLSNTRNLNGRLTGHRRQLLEYHGFVKDPLTQRWNKP